MSGLSVDVNVCWCSDLQNKKGNILQASVNYIKRLKKEQLAMSELVARQDELEETNRQLTLEIQVNVVYYRFCYLACSFSGLTLLVGSWAKNAASKSMFQHSPKIFLETFSAFTG